MCLALCAPAWPQANPVLAEESLTYNVNWPSGLSLGEVQLKAAKAVAGEGSGAGWNLEFVLDAAVPGFTVADRYSSAASAELCSVRFGKEVSRNGRTASEQTRFGQAAGTATRETLGGGSSTFSIGPCARDALAFLYHLRSELSQGRLPPPQTVYFGAAYQVRLEFAGRQRVTAGDQQFEADRITASVKGAASQISFEMFFAQDRTRRPLLVSIPLSLGVFAMELVP